MEYIKLHILRCSPFGKVVIYHTSPDFRSVVTSVKDGCNGHNPSGLPSHPQLIKA
ncbi:hypothetical protein [Brevibacillus laterosporus]|uniref:hypothetical protein n=1 Tax=Brevibacillus laterosporus TaxID=1465 RepID=UPI001A7EA3F5|nr:hypothetical protein [Brevibacillus laterosporus]